MLKMSAVPATQQDLYFRGEAERYIFFLLELDGKPRLDKLGVVMRHYGKKDIAEATGISTVSYYFYETDQQKPTADAIIKLSRFYNCSTDFLLGVSNSPMIIDPAPDDESAALEPAI